MRNQLNTFVLSKMEKTYSFTSHLTTVDGFMFCEGVKIKDLQQELSQACPSQPSPCFIYSKAQIKDNIDAYLKPLRENNINHILGFAIKANYNPSLLKIFQENGLSAIVVSGNELRLALKIGFDPRKIVVNGNGKQLWEIQLALQHGCLINIDSQFDLERIAKEAKRLKTAVKVMIRINPDIDPKVHAYLATGVGGSKFGLDKEDLSPQFWKVFDQNQYLKLVGVHCHLGSTIKNVEVFSNCLDFMMSFISAVKERGFNLEYLNIGGGLGIDYEKHLFRTDEHFENDEYIPVPSPGDLIAKVKETNLGRMCVVLEPGRSLIGQSAILVTKVIGSKTNKDTNFIIVDGSMNEVIRPSLYGSYHHIELTEPSMLEYPERLQFDVVGPVCECADFLGKNRWLPRPHESCGLAVFDAGAYCSSMSSNYNLRMRPAEVLVDGDKWKLIQHPDTLEHLLQNLTF